MPRHGSFVYYIHLQGLLIYYVPLQRLFVYYIPIRACCSSCVSIEAFVYYVPLQDFSFTMYLYKDLLFYLFFFRSVKICLCSSLSRNYVFESIGLPRFMHVLNSFTNYPIRHQSVLEYLKIRMCGVVTLFY